MLVIGDVPIFNPRSTISADFILGDWGFDIFLFWGLLDALLLVMRYCPHLFLVIQNSEGVFPGRMSGSVHFAHDPPAVFLLDQFGVC